VLAVSILADQRLRSVQECIPEAGCVDFYIAGSPDDWGSEPDKARPRDGLPDLEVLLSGGRLPRNARVGPESFIC